VDLEYETASTTSRRSKKTNGKGKTLTATKKFSLKAKPKKSGSFLVVNGKKIPLTNSKKSRRNKMSKGVRKASSVSKKRAVSAKRMVKKASKTKVAKKASSVGKKRAVASKSAKSMILKKKASPKSIKKTAKTSSALMKKRAASSKTSKNAPRLSNSQKKLKTKTATGAPATKKLLPSMDDIKEFLGVKQKAQPKSRPKSTSTPKKLMPSLARSFLAFRNSQFCPSLRKLSELMSTLAIQFALKKLMPSANDKKVSLDVKEEKEQGSNSLQSSSTGSESAGTKTIYMPIKQEANGQTAEAIIVEDKKKVEADLQDVKLLETKSEKKD